MGRRQRRRETVERLESKTLDARFRTELVHGLNCSPFEADAVCDVVREVYLPFFEPGSPVAPPGTISLIAVDAEEPAGKAVVDCRKKTVHLSVHRGAEDDRLLHDHGPAGFRKARLCDLCEEALCQGALLTAEDLAFRIFFVTPRTISRDLAELRQEKPQRFIPMRSTVHDLGPALTHRVQIVRLALQGKTTSQICRILHHSPAAVANYLSTFVRCAQLHHKGLAASEIASLLQRGPRLIAQYLDLLSECRGDPNLDFHLQQLLELGTAAVAKKKASRRNHAH
jgi:hypothetical protein